MFLKSGQFQISWVPSASGQWLLCICLGSFTFELALKFDVFENRLSIFVLFWFFFLSLSLENPLYTNVVLDSVFFKHEQIRRIFIFWINIEPKLLLGNLRQFIYCQIQCRFWSKITNLLESWSFTWHALRRLQLCINDYMRPSKLPLKNAPCSTIEL